MLRALRSESIKSQLMATSFFKWLLSTRSTKNAKRRESTRYWAAQLAEKARRQP